MAGISKPSVTGLGPEGTITITGKRLHDASGDPSKVLFDGVTNLTNIGEVMHMPDSVSGAYVTFDVKGSTSINLWRYGGSGVNMSMMLQKLTEGADPLVEASWVNLTATNYTSPSAANTWEKIGINLAPGSYRYKKNSSTGTYNDYEWYIELVIPPYNWKGVAVTEVGSIKVFTENNVWVTQPAPEGGVTKEYISANGLPRTKLLTSLDTMYVPMVNTKTYETGEKLWVTESDISTNLGITSMDLYQPTNGGYKVLLKVPPFLPKDRLASTDKMYYYNVAGSFPEFLNAAFSATVIDDHKSTIKVDFNLIHNFDEKIKIRHKINNGQFSRWSDPFYAHDVAPSSLINPMDLTLGDNKLTFEIAVDGDEQRTIQKVIDKAIKLNNEAPHLAIVQADSDAFRAHFVITDPNIGDSVKYRILIRNSILNDVVLVPWTELEEAPLEIVYNIDTSKVVVGKLNALIVEYQDNFGASASTTYSFEGSYRNLVFTDSHGEYYTTDKGVLLKLLHLGHIYAGSKSLAFPIIVKNSYGEPVTNMKISPIVIKDAGVEYQLSKTAEPFNPLPELSYGDEIIESGDTRTFYVRGVASEQAFGFGEFMLEVIGDVTDLPPEEGGETPEPSLAAPNEEDFVLKSSRLENI